MSYKISKELFEAVINVETISGITLVPKLKEYYYVDGISYTLKSGGGFISYDTFFFKCKEWAYSQGYIIYSSTKSCSMFKEEVQLYCSNEDIPEQQKIFDACQLIIDKNK